MNAAFTIDLIEQQGALLFVGGSSLLPLQVEDAFPTLLQDGKSAKSRRTLGTINLRIQTLIVDGEPVDAVAADQAALLGLVGDAAPLLAAAQSLRWQRKGKRLIRTSDDALTLALDS